VAKTRAELPPAEAIGAQADAQGRLAVRVTPGARAHSIAIEGGRVLIKVGARPEDGKANAAVLALLADALGIATSRLHLLRGAAAREKLIQIN
jgi:uncharacterized protein YggU (UPF0235/DUF167 family)